MTPPSPSSSSSPLPSSKEGNGDVETKALPLSRRRIKRESACSEPAGLSLGHSLGVGFTSSGQSFRIPDTFDTIDTLLPPHWSLVSLVTLSLVLINLALILSSTCSKWVHVGVFLVFRLSYDVGIGALLYGQSQRESFTRFYERSIERVGGPNSPHWWARLCRHLCRTQLVQPDLVDVVTLPSALRAWLIFKNIVNLVLINDGLNYLLLGLRCFHWPRTWTWLVIAQYLLGFALAAFNYWAKVDTYRVLANVNGVNTRRFSSAGLTRSHASSSVDNHAVYCWYFGDFFFRKQVTLTFDGIFELFPHPSYSVGYSLYYGYSLICRSYTMLFVSLIAHALQLTYLTLVEQPHIIRTYGTAEVLKEEDMRTLYDPRDGLFPARRDNVLFSNLDLLRSGDLSLVLLAVYACLLSAICDQRWLIVQLCAWRLLHFAGLGTVLWLQGTRDAWNQHFQRKGRTLVEAFEHWKRTYNLSLTINALVFTTLACREFHFSWIDLYDGWRMSTFILGLCGVALSLWSFQSTYSAIGEFGLFYGDFFIPPASYRRALCYTGIYRFLNNPDCVTGYAAQWGAALITQSWTVFWMAAMSHAMHIVFLNLVETPHMKRLYAAHERRGDAPFPKALEKLSSAVLPSPMREAQVKLEQDMRNAKLRAFQEMFSLYQKLDMLRGKHTDTDHAMTVELQVPDSIVIGNSLLVQFSTQNDHSASDWIGIFPQEVPSEPGKSGGRWLYVPSGSKGVVVFAPAMVPAELGVYEVRYHYANGYQVCCTQPFLVTHAPLSSALAK